MSKAIRGRCIFFLLFALLSFRANASTLSSMEALLPLYIAAVFLFVGLFLILPIYLVFRARKQHKKGLLTRSKLIAHLLPAGFIGIAGIIDFLMPFGFIPLVTAQLDGAMAVEYYTRLLLIIAINYLVWTTYQRCKVTTGEAKASE